MPIPIEYLRDEALAPDLRSVRSLNEARRRSIKTAFLCHSHLDKDLVLGVSNLLIKSGWRVYIDWQDTQMPPRPNKQTAKVIKDRIRSADYFLFLATKNSMNSRWCPWEIGYGDAHKYPDKLLIIPTIEGQSTNGSEYLSLYRRVDLLSGGGLSAIRPGEIYGMSMQSL